jgi:hypothetical protein
MATINGSTATYWTFKLEVTEGAVNVENNTSPLTVKAYIGRGASAGGSYMYGASISCPVAVTSCPRQTITYKNAARVDIAQGAWLHIGTVTFDVPHNEDGSKTVTVSASFTNNISPSSGSASGSMTLTTIPRASQPSCVTWPEHTQNVGEFGDTISIHMNRKSDRFVHDVRFKFGDLEEDIAGNVETGLSWRIPLSLMNRIPNDTKGSGTIFVKTYAYPDNTYTGERTYVGEKSCGFTATVPASVKPSVSATLEDIESIDDIYGSPVVTLSKIKVTTKVTPAYKSPIKSTRITIDGVTYAADTVTTDFLRNKGASKVLVTVTDQRERTGEWEYTMNVLDYTRPQILMLAVHRTNGDWEENDQGDHVSVTFSAQVSPMSNKNIADYTLQYKKTTEGEDAWQTIDLSEVDNNFTLYNYAVLFAADVASSYDVKLTVADRHDPPVTRSTSASTAFSLMDWHSSGTGIAFGKVAEHENTMDIGLQMLLTGGIRPVELLENVNLNDIKTTGWYRCGMSATAASLLNCPTDKAFAMEVLPNVPVTQRLTEYVQDSTPRIFVRNYYDYLDTWGLWYELVPRQNRIANVVSLIGLGADETYTFPSDGYLVLRAHYSSESYVNCILSGSNGKGFRLTATSGDIDNLTGNPTDALFVRKGMIVSDVDTSDTDYNALEFHPLY